MSELLSMLNPSTIASLLEQELNNCKNSTMSVADVLKIASDHGLQVRGVCHKHNQKGFRVSLIGGQA